MEDLVAVELLKQLGWSRTRAEPFHVRVHGGREVDLVRKADDSRFVQPPRGSPPTCSHEVGERPTDGAAKHGERPFEPCR